MTRSSESLPEETAAFYTAVETFNKTTVKITKNSEDHSNSVSSNVNLVHDLKASFITISKNLNSVRRAMYDGAKTTFDLEKAIAEKNTFQKILESYEINHNVADNSITMTPNKISEAHYGIKEETNNFENEEDTDVFNDFVKEYPEFRKYVFPLSDVGKAGSDFEIKEVSQTEKNLKNKIKVNKQKVKLRFNVGQMELTLKPDYDCPIRECNFKLTNEHVNTGAATVHLSLQHDLSEEEIISTLQQFKNRNKRKQSNYKTKRVEEDCNKNKLLKRS